MLLGICIHVAMCLLWNAVTYKCFKLPEDGSD